MRPRDNLSISLKRTLLVVVIFSVAFAFVEASVVVYLRQLLGASQPAISKEEVLLLLPGIAFLEPETALKIISSSALLNVELAREAATLLMLTSVSLLAARETASRIAFFLLAFGLWDIFYYVFLKLILDWPKSLMDLDIFFLIPVPWVGPVIVPLTISLILIVGSAYYLVKLEE